MLILKDLRVVVSLTLRSEILSILHQGHIGIERTKLRARNTVYWSEIIKDITELTITQKSHFHFMESLEK